MQHCQRRAGLWPVEYERAEVIADNKKIAVDAVTSKLFRFFNEIGIIAQLSQNLFESVMPEGLTLSQFSVLNHFVRLERTESPARLAKAFQVTKGAMTNTLARLEKQSFVIVEPDPKDGRAKLVDITPKGIAVHWKCVNALAPLLAKIGTDMSLDGFARALPQLEKVRQYLDEARG